MANQFGNLNKINICIKNIIYHTQQKNKQKTPLVQHFQYYTELGFFGFYIDKNIKKIMRNAKAQDNPRQSDENQRKEGFTLAEFSYKTAVIETL